MENENSVYNLYFQDCVENGLDKYIKVNGNKVIGPNPNYGTSTGNPTRFRIDTDKNIWYDFGDGKGGSDTQYLIEIRGLPPDQAKALTNNEVPATTSINEIYSEVKNFYIENLKDKPRPIEYLKARNFADYDIVDFQIGYAGDIADQLDFFNQLKKKYGNDTFEAAGLTTAEGRPIFDDRIIVPFHDAFNRVVYFGARSIDSMVEPRYMYPSVNERSFYGLISNKKTYVVEGLFDALALEAHGYSAISLLSASADKYQILDLVTRAAKNKSELVFIRDMDDPGYKLFDRFLKICEQLGVVCAIKPLPKSFNNVEPKDPDEYFRSFETKIAAIEHFNELPEIHGIKYQMTYLSGISSLEEIEQVAYRISYYRSELTKGMLKAFLAEQTGLSKSDINKTIVDKPKIDKWIKEGRPKQETVKFSKERLEEVLKDPNILDDICKITEDLGHVGESKLKKALTLAVANRISDNPIHIQLVGESSSGKSSTVDAILQLFDPTEVFCLTSLSKQAINYIGDFNGGIKHKVLYLGENGGSTDEEVVRAVRQLMSEGKIIRAISMKSEETGTIELQLKITEGPATVISTTVSLNRDDEMDTRVMLLNTDNSAEQTRRIQQAQYKGSQSVKTVASTHKRDLYKNALTLLKPYKVIIPFATFLEFPNAKPRTRRDNQRMIDMIRASALVHQYQRDIVDFEGKKYIKATLVDYAIVYNLLSLIPSCIGDVPKQIINLHAELLANFGHRKALNIQIIRKYKGCDAVKAKQYLEQLEIASLARKTGVGWDATYELTDTPRKVEIKSVLSPDQVKNRVIETIKDELKIKGILGVENLEYTYTILDEDDYVEVVKSETLEDSDTVDLINPENISI